MDLNSSTYQADYDALCRGVIGETVLDRLYLTIMHGNGNVIAIVDEARSLLSPREVNGDFARRLCQSFTFPRVDGIAFLSTNGPRTGMTYFERDGTRSQMCGNALRCATRYCAEQGYLSGEGFIATDDGPKWVSATGGRIQVALGFGREFRKLAEDRYFVFTGLPHLVVVVDDLESVDVKTEGAALRYDAGLCALLNHPEGLHVDFVQRDEHRIVVRTYEVGVEDETLACGTGVAASAFVAHEIWQRPFPLRVQTLGGGMSVDANEHGLVISGLTDSLFSTTGQRLGA